MTFPEAVSSGLSKYATFSGRATRSEYWWFFLFTVLAQVVATFVDSSIGNSGLVAGIVGLALLLPTIAVTARRFHDIDKAGWWMLIPLLPVIGFILYIIWMCTKGSLGENRFGPPAQS